MEYTQWHESCFHMNKIDRLNNAAATIDYFSRGVNRFITTQWFMGNPVVEPKGK